MMIEEVVPHKADVYTQRAVRSSAAEADVDSVGHRSPGGVLRIAIEAHLKGWTTTPTWNRDRCESSHREHTRRVAIPEEDDLETFGWRAVGEGRSQTQLTVREIPQRETPGAPARLDTSHHPALWVMTHFPSPVVLNVTSPPLGLAGTCYTVPCRSSHSGGWRVTAFKTRTLFSAFDLSLRKSVSRSNSSAMMERGRDVSRKVFEHGAVDAMRPTLDGPTPAHPKRPALDT